MMNCLMGRGCIVVSTSISSPSLIGEYAEKTVSLGADGIEARLDYLDGDLHDPVLWRAVSRYRNHIIVTLRDKRYGGYRSFTMDEARYVFEMSLKDGFILDLDLDNAKSILEETSAKANIIVSMHTWSMGETLDLAGRIGEVIDYVLGFKNRILGFKVGFYIDKLNNRVLESMTLALYKIKNSGLIPVIVPMGPETSTLRLIYYLLGSKILYTSMPNKQLAPGQPEITYIVKMLKNLKSQ